MRVTKKNQQQNGHREIVDAVKALCSEKDIEPEVLFSAIEEAMKAAYKKNVSRDEDAPSNLSVTMDRNTGDVHVFARKTITDDVEDPANQITLEEALKIRRDYRMGDIAEIDVTPNGFLRTAAQTAKQVIMQRIREAEQGRIYEEYSDKENEILTAIVQRVEPKGVYVELGRTEGIMEPSEYMPGEEYHIDDHIKVYVLEVNRTGREMLHGPQVRVSRIHPGLVKRLFEMEVPEINDGLITIKKIARIPGERAKIAVESYDDRIDPVGACVGVKGSRIHGIVRELRNENIDVINYTSNIQLFIQRALSPAKISSIVLHEEDKKAEVYLKPEEVSLAIGKGGMNIKLASMLTEYTIDVYRELDENAMDEDIYLDEFKDEIDEWVINAIKGIGLDTAKAVINAPREMLIEKADLEEDTVDDVLRILRAEFEE